MCVRCSHFTVSRNLFNFASVLIILKAETLGDFNNCRPVIGIEQTLQECELRSRNLLYRFPIAEIIDPGSSIRRVILTAVYNYFIDLRERWASTVGIYGVKSPGKIPNCVYVTPFARAASSICLK